MFRHSLPFLEYLLRQVFQIRFVLLFYLKQNKVFFCNLDLRDLFVLNLLVNFLHVLLFFFQPPHCLLAVSQCFKFAEHTCKFGPN